MYSFCKSFDLDQGFFLAIAFAQKLKDEKTQTQEKFPKNSRNFFHENSRNRQIGVNFGQILIKNSNFRPKIAIFGEKMEIFPKTQAPNLSKTQEIDESINPILGEKRLKNPGLN